MKTFSAKTLAGAVALLFIAELFASEVRAAVRPMRAN